MPLTFVRYDCTQEELLLLLPWDEEENLKADFEPGKLLELGMEMYVEDPPKRRLLGLACQISGPTPSAYRTSRLRLRNQTLPDLTATRLEEIREGAYTFISGSNYHNATIKGTVKKPKSSMMNKCRIF